MRRRWIAGSVAAVLGVAVVAQAGASREELRTTLSDLRRESFRIDTLQHSLQVEMAEFQTRLQERLTQLDRRRAALARQVQNRTEETVARLAHALGPRLEQATQSADRLQERIAEIEATVLLPDDGTMGWLGVMIDEVTPEKVKKLKLPAERGVYVREVSPESPAAKAGLRTGDVITEFNGQRIEGGVQFRRIVRETPAGRTVQLAVWRDGRGQTVSLQVGNLHRQVRKQVHVVGPEPPDFDFHLEMPRLEFFPGPTPVLGIQADDLGGQLGAYFGVPEGEGVLVREVGPGTPAEKAGLKAGDVITKADGSRVRTTSELRAKLREKREKNEVVLSVVRNRAEVSLRVELEPPKPPESRRARVIQRRTAV